MRRRIEKLACEIDSSAWEMPDNADKMTRRLAARDKAILIIHAETR